MASNVAGPEIERLIQLLARLPGLGPAFGPPRRAAPHPQARDAAAAARRGDARRRRADRRPARSAATSTRAILARSAPIRAATLRPSWSSNRSAICGRSNGRARSGRAITCWAASCRRSTGSVPTISPLRRSSRASPPAASARSSWPSTRRSTARRLRITSPIASADYHVKVTRLAHGVPVGGELDYLDDGTIAAAMRQRTAF